MKHASNSPVTTAAAEVRLALLGAWVTASLVAAAVLLAAAAVPAQVALRLAPRCVWKAHHGRDCPGCGMTRALLLAARGRCAEAMRTNRASLPVFGLLVVNELLCAMAARRWMRRRSSRGRDANDGITPETKKPHRKQETAYASA